MNTFALVRRRPGADHRDRLERYVAALVDEAPPLTPEQAARLRLLLTRKATAPLA